MNLPFEILEEIFLYLHQREKLKCMLVCHHWKQVMEQGILYDTVCLYTADGTEKLTRKISSNPTIGKKVNRLILFAFDDDPYPRDPGLILSILPNIQTLYTSSYYYDDFEIHKKKTILPFFNRIQTIYEQQDSVIVYPVLSSHMYPHLTTLRVYNSDNSIIPHLKNAPNLKSLDIDPLVNNICEFFTIYNYAPYIQYINFRSIYMAIPNLDNVDLTPASSVTECVFRNVDFDMPIYLVNLLTFIGIKYPNLTRLTFHATQEETRFTKDDVVYINEHGWTPLYQKLGPQLKKLDVRRCTFKEQLESLDDADARINYLSVHCKYSRLLRQLAVSNQTHYIQTLVLEMINPLSFRWLENFKVLVKLKLGFITLHETHSTVCLPDILTYAPPTLKKLSIYRSVVSIANNCDGGIPSNIAALSFRHVKLPDDIDAFISRYFPHLSRLKLKHCDMVGRTFNLEKLNLFSFCFIGRFEEELSGGKISVLTLCNKESRFYDINDKFYMASIHKHLRSLYQPYTTRLLTDIDSEPGFKLICHSLKSITFY